MHTWWTLPPNAGIHRVTRIHPINLTDHSIVPLLQKVDSHEKYGDFQGSMYPFLFGGTDEKPETRSHRRREPSPRAASCASATHLAPALHCVAGCADAGSRWNQCNGTPWSEDWATWAGSRRKNAMTMKAKANPGLPFRRSQDGRHITSASDTCTKHPAHSGIANWACRMWSFTFSEATQQGFRRKQTLDALSPTSSKP